LQKQQFKKGICRRQIIQADIQALTRFKLGNLA
jgi:hypothetical protein